MIDNLIAVHSVQSCFSSKRKQVLKTGSRLWSWHRYNFLYMLFAVKMGLFLGIIKLYLFFSRLKLFMTWLSRLEKSLLKLKPLVNIVSENSSSS